MTEITLGQRYVLNKRIGQGGEGTVYETTAVDGTHVAVKELHGLVADLEQHHLQSQLHVLASLEGIPGIPAIKERGFHAGRYYIVSDFIEGKTLEEVVASGRRFDRQEAENFMRYMLETIQVCHERGIIIRDIRPDNIKLNGRPWIVDISALGDAYAESKTMGMGTLGFAAPEQKDNEEIFASDIYSLGKTIYRAITGKKVSATKELTSEDFAVMRKVAPGLTGIIEKMCQPDLAQRYQSAMGVLHDLNTGQVTQPMVLAKTTEKASRLSWWEALVIACNPSVGSIQLGPYKIVQRDQGYVIIDKKRNILFGTDERPLTERQAKNCHFVQDGDDSFIMNFFDEHWFGLRSDGTILQPTTINGRDYIPLSSPPNYIVWNEKAYSRYQVGGNVSTKYLTTDGEEMPDYLRDPKTIQIRGLHEDYAVINKYSNNIHIIGRDNKPAFGGLHSHFVSYDNAGGLEVMVVGDRQGSYNQLDIKVVTRFGEELYKREGYYSQNTKSIATQDGRVFRQLSAIYKKSSPESPNYLIADQEGTIIWRGCNAALEMQVISEKTLRIRTEEGFTNVSI